MQNGLLKKYEQLFWIIQKQISQYFWNMILLFIDEVYMQLVFSESH